MLKVKNITKLRWMLDGQTVSIRGFAVYDTTRGGYLASHLNNSQVPYCPVGGKAAALVVADTADVSQWPVVNPI
ncbi:hypothetical protein [Endozoicomonas sp. 2B-B]